MRDELDENKQAAKAKAKGFGAGHAFTSSFITLLRVCGFTTRSVPARRYGLIIPSRPGAARNLAASAPSVEALTEVVIDNRHGAGAAALHIWTGGSGPARSGVSFHGLG